MRFSLLLLCALLAGCAGQCGAVANGALGSGGIGEGGLGGGAVGGLPAASGAAEPPGAPLHWFSARKETAFSDGDEANPLTNFGSDGTDLTPPGSLTAPDWEADGPASLATFDFGVVGVECTAANVTAITLPAVYCMLIEPPDPLVVHQVNLALTDIAPGAASSIAWNATLATNASTRGATSINADVASGYAAGTPHIQCGRFTDNVVGGNIETSVNGGAAATAAPTGASETLTYVTFGAFTPLSCGNPFKGRISEVVIWNDGTTQAQGAAWLNGIYGIY